MNAFVHFLAISSVTGTLLAAAGYVGRPTSATVVTPSSVEFGSHVRSKVVQYFETLEDGRPGAVVDGSETAMVRGRVLSEVELESMTDVPKELERVLPATPPQSGYHIAGNYLVALNSRHKVLDSIKLPPAHPAPARNRELAQWVRHATVGR